MPPGFETGHKVTGPEARQQPDGTLYRGAPHCNIKPGRYQLAFNRFEQALRPLGKLDY